MAADKLIQRWGKIERQRKARRSRRGGARGGGGRGDGRRSAVPWRINDLTNLFKHRYGGPLPDDDAGLEDAWIMVRHQAFLYRNDQQRVLHWLATWAPWMSPAEAETMIARAAAVTWLWKADTLGRKLN